MKMGETLAKRYFEIDMKRAEVSSQVEDVLDGAFGGGWSDWTADFYDESIEVYDAERTVEAIEALRSAGFAQCWIHPHPRSLGPCSCQVVWLRSPTKRSDLVASAGPDPGRLEAVQAFVTRIDAAVIRHDGDDARYEPSLTWLASRVEKLCEENAALRSRKLPEG